MDEDPKVIQHTGKEGWNSWKWSWRETSHGYSGHINKTKKGFACFCLKTTSDSIWFTQICFCLRRLKGPAQLFLNRDWHELNCKSSPCFSIPPPPETTRCDPLPWAVPWTQRQQQSEGQPTSFPSLPICSYFGIYTLCHPSHSAHR